MKRLLLVGLLLSTVCAFGQGAKYENTVVNQYGRPMNGASVRLCTPVAPASPTTLCSTLANVYSDAALSQSLSNPIAVSNGNYSFFAAPGYYWRQILSASGSVLDSQQIMVSVTTPLGDVSAKSLNGVKMADQYTGTDAGAKIAAAIADLPSQGGTVDARGLTGAQAIGATITVNKPAKILLGAATFSHASDAFVITSNGASVEGQGDATVFTPTGSSAADTIKVTTTQPSTTVALGVDAKEGDLTLTLESGGATTLGLAAGDYILVTDSETKGQVHKIRSVSGDTVSLSDFVFRAAAASGSTVKKLALLSGVKIGNFRVNGAGNSNTNSSGVEVNFCAGCTVHDVTADNDAGYALRVDTGYGNTFRNITSHGAGNALAQTGGGFLLRQTQATYDNISIFDPLSWGMAWTLHFASTMSNVNVTSNGRQQTGRGIKFSSSSYNRTTNLGETGFSTQNFILEAGSSSNQFTNCYALGNGMYDNGGGAMGGSGINTFGNANNNNRFVNCTAKFNGGAQINITVGDLYNSIIGGEYCCNRASGTVATVQAGGDYTTVSGADVWTDKGDGQDHTGIGVTTGGTGQVIVGNKLHGFISGYDIWMSPATISNSLIVGNQFPDGVTGYATQTDTIVANNVGIPGPSSSTTGSGSAVLATGPTITSLNTTNGIHETTGDFSIGTGADAVKLHYRSGSGVACINRNIETDAMDAAYPGLCWGMYDATTYAFSWWKADGSYGSLPLKFTINGIEATQIRASSLILASEKATTGTVPACFDADGKLTSACSPTVTPDYYVATTGSDAAGCGTKEAPCATITYADAHTSISGGKWGDVACGTYPDAVVTSKSGSSGNRILWKAHSPGCAIISTTSGTDVWTNNGDWVRIEGFDLTNTTTANHGILNWGSNVQTVANYVHDIPVPAVGCTDGGAGIDNAAYGSVNNDVLGNKVLRIGVGANLATSCAQGIYQAQNGGLIQNNLVGDTTKDCVALWHAATNQTISNNTMFFCGQGTTSAGVNVGQGDAGATADGIKNTKVTNNVIYDANAGVMEQGTVGTGQVYDSNLCYSCNAPYYNANTSNTTMSVTPTNTKTTDPGFVNYQADGTGDYRLTGAIAGSATYSPITDILSMTRKTPPTLGAYEY